MKDPKDWRTKLVFDDIEQETISPSAFSISSAETHAMDLKYKSHEDRTQQQPNDHTMLHVGDNVIGSVSSVLDPHQMCGLMEQRAQLGMDKMIIGVKTATDQSIIILEDEDVMSDRSGEETLDDLTNYEDTLEDIDIDKIFMAGVDAMRLGTASIKHLTKLWRISYEEAKRTLDITTQHSVRTQDPTLSQNYGANDCMLWYRQINEYFYMDTFFATLKGGKSSWGNTCCQLFVSNKGYIYIVPIKYKSEVLQAIKQSPSNVGINNTRATTSIPYQEDRHRRFKEERCMQ